MSIWVSIPNQGPMKYEIYSSIEHGNVNEQQMSGIHVQNQIGYTSTVMTLNSQFSIHCIFSVVCGILHNTILCGRISEPPQI